MDGPEAGELWTCGRVAEHIGMGVTARMVRRMVDEGELPGLRPGRGRWRRIPAEAAEAKRLELVEQLSAARRARLVRSV